MDEHRGELKMAVRGSTEAFAVQQLSEEARVALARQLQERRDQVRSLWRQVVRHSVRPPRRLGGHLEDVLKGLEVYEVMDTRGLTV
jgi:hypothetical protein